MKRFAIIITLLLAVVFANAQSSKVTTAHNYLKAGKLEKAATAIDGAIQHPKTIGKAKTWVYRAKVYYQIAVSQDATIAEKYPTAIDLAYESAMKAQELDEKNEYLLNDILPVISACADKYYNMGVLAWNEKRYTDAADGFYNSFKITKELNIGQGNSSFDTAALFNVAVASAIGGDTERAKSVYGELYNYGYKRPEVYKFYAEYLTADGSSEEAYKVIKEGREAFPTDMDLLIAEINAHLANENNEEVLNLLQYALQLDTMNASIYEVVGNQYDAIASDTSFTEDERMGAFENAESAYKRAIELSPEAFNSIYNLGALYFNTGVIVLQNADLLPLGDPNYDTEKERGDKYLKESIPYLEKALELNPSDYNTLVSLSQIYPRFGDTENYQRVKKILDNLE